MTLRYLFIFLCAGHTGWAQAEIYKSIDAEGHVTYSSVPSKGAKKLGLESPSPPSASPETSSPSRTSPPSSARARNRATPSDFPRVDYQTQKNRDNTRHRILADELSTEEKLLADARQNLKTGESARSTPQEMEKLRRLQEEVTLHEKNISALKTELSHLR